MNVNIEEIEKTKEEQILIQCHEQNDSILSLAQDIRQLEHPLLGYLENTAYPIRINDVYYFEAVDNHVFIYCEKQVYESKLKLYELELLSGNYFRATKSTIININQIQSTKPSLSGRFRATLRNGEVVEISRQYVPILKNMLGIGGQGGDFS